MIRLVLAVLALAPLSGAVDLSPSAPYLDIRNADWEYAPASSGAPPRTEAASAAWKSVRMGKRWDELGYPAMKFQPVWARLRFGVPAALAGRKIGFFATLIDDESDIYVNGLLAGRTVAHLGYALPEPSDIDLTPFIRFRQPNELLILLRDKYVRSPGIIGNVGLYHSLPYARTGSGGIALTGSAQDVPVSVFLHTGSAVLSRSGDTGFSASELRALEIPPGILREDELILVTPAAPALPPPHRVELDFVNPTSRRQRLAVSCAALPASVPLYELLALPVDAEGSFDNPFDPREMNVQAVVQTPSGKVEKVFAFFQQEFDAVQLNSEEEILLPRKSPAWKVYYRPREVGVHRVELFAQDRTGVRRHRAGSFEAVQSSSPGFLRVSRNDPRFFEYSNGQSFFGIGPSGWYRGPNYIFGGNPRWVPFSQMEAFYERKAANRSNYEYLGSFHYGRLLIRRGFIDPHIAWKLERTLRTMERLKIRWIFFHDDMRRYYRYGFDTLPYSVAQGGPAVEINEYYINEEALRWQKNQLRHIVSRMADSPSIWMWNIGDEWRDQPGNKLSVPLVRSWMKELHEYVRGIDIYQHPHAIGEGEEAIQNGGDVLPIEDWYLNHPPHKDNDWRKGGKRDLVSLVEQQLEKYKSSPFPLIDVEGGLYGWNSGIAQSGKEWDFPEGLTFHQHLWLSLFLKSAAGGTEWLVNVLDHDRQLFHAKAFANYLEGEQLTKAKWLRSDTAGLPSGLSGWALTTDGRSLVWVLNRTWNWLDWVDGKRPVASQPFTLRVPVQTPGSYVVEFWNTNTGQIDSTLALVSREQWLHVPMPGIQMDSAIKCVLSGRK